MDGEGNKEKKSSSTGSLPFKGKHISESEFVK